MSQAIRHKPPVGLREALRNKTAGVKKHARTAVFSVIVPAVISYLPHSAKVDKQVPGERLTLSLETGTLNFNLSGASVSLPPKTTKIKYGLTLKRVYPMEGLISYEVNGLTNTGWWIQVGISEGTRDIFRRLPPGKKSGFEIVVDRWKNNDRQFKSGTIDYPVFNFRKGDSVTMSMSISQNQSNTNVTIHINDKSQGEEISLPYKFPLAAGKYFSGVPTNNYDTGITTEQISTYPLSLSMYGSTNQTYTQLLPKMDGFKMRLFSRKATFNIRDRKFNYYMPTANSLLRKKVNVSMQAPSVTTSFVSVYLKGGALSITTENKN